jgi:2,3,4,5-tetrahydropyridine-2-carboxylate N-succinyltransferase
LRVTEAPASAWGLGLATLVVGGADDGAVLDVWFPAPTLGEPGDDYPGDLAARLDALAGPDDVRRVKREVRQVTAALQEPATTTEDMWLRLHLLSHRLARPHTIVMDGAFGLLTNVVWTSAGPCAVDGFEETRARLQAAGHRVAVYGVDKFPRMVDYVVPAGVRIADGDRVRLGAHLAEGTTVMHEGFVNFNAGTLGPSMVEGRISAGVVVGRDSDVGGGASVMGTLSGGGRQVISIGERCLVGANAGIGISLGDDCVVEAGCYVTAGTKVTMPGGQVVKAMELSGSDHVLFRRNSVSGAVEAVPWKAGRIELNAALHDN